MRGDWCRGEEGSWSIDSFRIMALHAFKYACDLDDSNFYELISECKEQYPSTEVVVIKRTIDYQVIGYQYDTTSEENTLMLIDDILNLWGRLDIWVAV